MSANAPTKVPLPTPRAWELFGKLIELPREQRESAARERCGGDDALLNEVIALLAADNAPSTLLDKSIDPAQIMSSNDVDSLIARDGTDVGPYTLLDELGRGGMGVVYRAERRGGVPGHHVAVKVIKRGMDSEEIVTRFMREREILAQLRHPNIALLIDGGMAPGGQAWFAMELVEGLIITQWCDRERLDIDARVRLFIDVCAAVSHAHRNLVVHRDLKPGNILVDSQGHVKLLDFGVAKLLDASGASSRTASQLRLLTPEFAAPEQFSDGPITTATDVYQLGLVLYELVMGHRLRKPIETAPLEPDDATVADLPSLSVAAWKRATSADLARIIHKAAHPDAARRYATVSEFADDLQRYLNGLPVRAQPDRVSYRIAKFLKRHTAASALTAILLLALIAATIFSAYQANLARTQLARADAVRQFLVGIFRNADPDATKGEPFTALTLLAQSERDLDDDSQRTPAVQADLTGVLGEAYLNLGDYTKADALVRRANTLSSAAGVPSTVTARNLRILAQLDRGQSRFDDAIRHAREALAIAPDTIEGGERESTEVRRILADALVSKGELDEAEAVERIVLEDDKLVHGVSSQPVVGDLMMFGRIYDRTDRDADAETTYRQAIAAALAAPDRSTSDLAYTYNSLGILLRNKKADYAGADAALAEAERLYARYYGADNRNVWAVRANRVGGYEMQGDIAQALPGREAMLAHFRQKPDEEAANVAWSLFFVARDEGSLGRFDAATQHAQESADAWRKLQGPDGLEAVYPLQVLAQIAELRGQFEDARARYDEVVAMAARNKAADAKRLVEETRGSIGNLVRLQGHIDDALSSLLPATAALESFGNPNDLGLLSTQARLVEAQLDHGDIAQADTNANQLLGRALKILPPASLRRSSVLYAIGRVDIAMHRADDALTHLRDARAIRAKLMPADDIRVLEIDAELARALAQSGQEEASHRLIATIQPLLMARKDAYALTLSKRLDVMH